MPSATLTSKGQITLPKSVRDGLGIRTGGRVEFVEMDKGVYRMVAATREIREIKGSIPKPPTPVSVEDMRTAVRQHAVRRNAARR
jgi:AbrB family looped-hinge helix DNA binding protein